MLTCLIQSQKFLLVSNPSWSLRSRVEDSVRRRHSEITNILLEIFFVVV